MLLHALAPLLHPAHMFWGVNMLAYLPSSALILPLVGIALLGWMLTGKMPLFSYSGRGSQRTHVMVLGAIAVALVIANIDAFVLGDAGTVASQIIRLSRGEDVATRAPLSLAMMRGLYAVSEYVNPRTANDAGHLVSDAITNTVREASNAEFAFTLAGIIAFIVLAVMLVTLMRHVVEDQAQRVWASLFFICSGTLVFFAGYMELYLLPFVAITGFHLSVIAVLNERKQEWWMIASFALACASHVGAAVFLPVLLLALWHLHRGAPLRLLASVAGTAAAVLAMLLLSGYTVQTMWYVVAAKSTESGSHFIPLFHTTSRAQAYGAFSPYHVADLVNLVLLVNPVGLIIILLSLGTTTRERLYRRPVESVLLVSTLISLAMLFITNCDIGMVADWDFLSLYTVPTVITGLWFLMKHGPASRIHILRVSCVLLCVHTGLWLWNCADDDAAVRRIGAMQNARTFSSDGLFITTSHVARHFGRQDDIDAMVRPWERYVQELNPNDPRGYFTLSRLYERMRREGDAAALLARAVEKGIDDYRIDGALADRYQARGEWAAAITMYRKYIDRLHTEQRDLRSEGQAWASVAGCYVALDSAVKAVDACERSLALVPDNVDAIGQLAMAYIRLDRVHEAIPLLRDYMRLTPDPASRESATRILQAYEDR
jgi:hypothetical protein